MENLGSVSEARLGLAQWPSLREHGKFAGSICHSQHELRKRTRKQWLNGLDPWLALVDVRRSAAPLVRWDYQKLYQAETLSSRMHPTLETRKEKYAPPTCSGDISTLSLVCRSIKPVKHHNKYNKRQGYHSQTSRWMKADPVCWESAPHWHKQLIIQKMDV